MRQIFFLVLLFITTGLFAQAPSNYTNINGRYRWIAGMFDSTFHIPKGTTTSLRTGGSTNAGALFYRTTDSSVYYYTGTQWLKVAGASGFVPYTGATQNVNLGQFGLTTKFVQFDTSSQAVTDRRLQWSNAEGTLQFGMTNGSTITQRIGLEQFARVRNLQGDTIEAGDVVYVSGASGDRASVKLADNRADSTSSKTLGVATEQILPNDVGLVGTFGVVGKLNLSAFTAGDVVYLDSIPGKLTKVKPQAPYHMVFVGIVERANAGNGLLFVNVQNGYELEELHNVRITSPVRNNAILAYDSVGRLWKDTTLNAIGGITGSGTSGQVSYFNGTNSITSSPTFAFTPTSQLLLNNSVTAASAIARGMNVTSNLTAAANNDVLVGLDISPTFTNGAFTGVNRFGLRVLNSRINFGGTFAGSVGESLNPQYFLLINPSYTSVNNSATNIVRITPSVNLNNPGIQTAAALYIEPTYTNVGSANLYSIVATGNNLFGGAGAATSFSGSNVNFLGQAGASTNLNASAPNGQGFRIRVNSTAAQLNFEVDGSGNSDVRFVTANTEKLRIFNNGNVTIQNGGTHTDAGFKLDVNGTARVQGTATITPAANTSALVSSAYSLTGSNAQSLIDLAGTWNTTGNPTAIKLNITNTTSGANADLMELQVGGVNQFLVSKAGNTEMTGSVKTGAPSGGTAQAWKLGSVVASSVTYDPNNYVEVEINGSAYKLALAIPSEPEPLSSPDGYVPNYGPIPTKPVVPTTSEKVANLEKKIAELESIIQLLKSKIK
jgi:hypothetical protein